jgi:hypothetical protein
MNVTRDVVTDLLPLYFSGEAREDTRRLVEDFFREDPDFERVARTAAKPLEGLRNAAPAAPEAEKEKCEMQRIGRELRSRRGWLALAAYFTLWPLVSLVSSGLGAWLGAPHTWSGRIAEWSIAAYFLLMYVIRPARRNLPLVWAIFVSAGETALILNRMGVIPDRAARASNLSIIGIGALAALFWFLHIRSRRLSKHKEPLSSNRL